VKFWPQEDRGVRPLDVYELIVDELGDSPSNPVHALRSVERPIANARGRRAEWHKCHVRQPRNRHPAVYTLAIGPDLPLDQAPQLAVIGDRLRRA